MTAKKPAPEYDESIVQKLDYVPTSHKRGEWASDGPVDLHRWDGGFFEEGRRNPFPWRRRGEPFVHPSTDGLGSLVAAADQGKVCHGCHHALPLSSFSPKPGRTYLLRSRCDRCVERAKTKRKKDND